MKNTKKLPTKQLEKFSAVFMQLGLVLVLFMVYVTLEYETEIKPLAISFEPDQVKTPYVNDIETIIIKRKTKPKPKISKTPKAFNLDEIKKGDNDIIETILPDDLEDDDVQMIDPDDIVEVIIPETPVENEVIFINIEDAPVFKGCEGLSKEENKICFEKKIRQFVQKNFDAELAGELDLHAGKHKIYTQFIINQKGEIANLKVRAPHKRLEKEVQRIINKLPKFIPGKQRNKPVKVRYTLPIAFSVE